MKPNTVEIDIDLPRHQVIELFNNQENLFKWQTGLQRFEHLSGEPGQPGARSNLHYLLGKRPMVLTETIIDNNLPDEFNGRYEWPGGENTLRNRFLELGSGRTRWVSTCDYKFSSTMMKLMGCVMPGMFRRQNLRFLQNFKAFCEEGRDIRESIQPT